MIRTIWNRIAISPRFLGGISVLLTLGMLTACLWPFHAPKNTASPMAGGGIAFDRHGVLLSSGSLTVPGDRDNLSCSLELWLEPNPSRSFGTILAFYSPENPRLFTINQWRTGLALRTASKSDPIRAEAAPFFAPDVFIPGKPVFITITSGERGTEAYVNGALIKASPVFSIPHKVLLGRFIAGTSASDDNGWPGQLRGLAIYDRTLSAAEVRTHSATWAGTGRPEISDSNALLALYLLEEKTGRSFRSEITGGPDLYLPERYVVPAKSAFSAPSLDNGEDIIANIVGFMPLGFTLCGYLITSRRTRQTLVATIAICGALSLMIESLQVFLPTRDSDLTDVITNLIGSAIGAFIYHWGASKWSADALVTNKRGARAASAGGLVP